MTGFVALVVVGAILLTLYLKGADRLSRRNTITLVVFVCAATVIIQADAYAQRAAIHRTQDIIQGCARVDDAALDLGSFPIAIRALRGHLDDVHLRADIVEVADLRMHDLDVDVERVRFRLLGSPEDLDIERAEASVRIEQRELDRLLADLGIPATTTVTRDGISLQLPPAVNVELEIAVREGAAVVSVPGLTGLVDDLELSIPGVTIEAIEPTTGALEARATATGRPRDLVCDAAATLEQRFQPLSLIADLAVDD